MKNEISISKFFLSKIKNVTFKLAPQANFSGYPKKNQILRQEIEIDLMSHAELWVTRASHP